MSTKNVGEKKSGFTLTGYEVRDPGILIQTPIEVAFRLHPTKATKPLYAIHEHGEYWLIKQHVALQCDLKRLVELKLYLGAKLEDETNFLFPVSRPISAETLCVDLHAFSPTEAIEMAKKSWTLIKEDIDEDDHYHDSYEVTSLHKVKLPPPRWSARNLDEIVEEAFYGRIIDSMGEARRRFSSRLDYYLKRSETEESDCIDD